MNGKGWRHGYKLRRRSDGKFFRKNGQRFVYVKEINDCIEISHDEAHYHDNEITAHLYPTLEKAIASIGNGVGWSSGRGPIQNKEEILDLEIVPAIQYKNEHVEFGEPIEAFWFLDEIEKHFLPYG